ncbi:MAG: flagellar protein FlgN [Porticoccaceae bacterium]
MSSTSFMTLLRDEVDHLKLLRNALQQEAQTLLNQDAMQIEASVAQKSILLEQQSSLTRNREALVEHMTGENGLQALDALASSDSDNTLTTLVAELKTLTNECRTINQNNGKLILKRQRHAANALNILRQTDTGVAVYSDRGDTVESKSSRTLGKA